MGKKIFTINPGSTSTKVGLYNDMDEVFVTNVRHDSAKLAEYSTISEQLPYRKETILRELELHNIDLKSIDAFAARGGLCYPVKSGTYAINDLLIEDLKAGAQGHHPSNLAAQVALDFSKLYGAEAYIVNPEVVDELIDVARITGIKGVYRKSLIHALNQKETCIRCATKIGKAYSDANFVIAHLGGGISVSAHRKGEIIDTTDAVNGDGPMAPNRSGDIPATAIIDLCYSGNYTKKEMHELVSKKGGLISHLGTDSLVAVGKMVDDGDDYASLIYHALIHQIGKYIGAYASVLHGNVDRVILTGGLANDKRLVEKVSEMVKYIAPIVVYPGEFELEALAAGALSILNGENTAKTYLGKDGAPAVGMV